MTSVFSRPLVAFHISSIVSIIDGNSLAAPRSNGCLTLFACFVRIDAPRPLPIIKGIKWTERGLVSCPWPGRYLT